MRVSVTTGTSSTIELTRRGIYLEDVRDVGLLWNTSIAGHFLTRPIGENATDSIDLLERIHRDEWTHTVTGRLVLTNLAFSKPLDFLLPNVAGSDSQYVIVDDPKVRLTTAAALNANFPPVFSNAGVDLPEGHRYWVTDGGALDNSGLESLLYAMRQAIDKTDWTKCTPPTIHVITADAGAYSEKYSQDRGVSTALGAGTVFASRLSSELARDIAARYKGIIGFHYLEMPKTLRRSGSFGTHWMLQPNITVAPDNGSPEVTLSGEEVVALTRALFSGRTDQLSPKAVSVYDATKHNFDASWNELLKELGNPAR